MVDEPTLRWIFEQANGAEPPQDYLDQRVGKFTPFQCIEEAINSPSAVAFRNNNAATQAAKDQQIADLTAQLATQSVPETVPPTPTPPTTPTDVSNTPPPQPVTSPPAAPSEPSALQNVFTGLVNFIKDVLGRKR